jgi:hypothetical protein
LSDGFDPIWHHSQVETARAKRVEQLKSNGENRAYLYTADENMLGGLIRSICLWISLKFTAYRPNPKLPTRNLVSGSFFRGDFGWLLDLFHFRNRGMVENEETPP